jgi:hypothetical protein
MTSVVPEPFDTSLLISGPPRSPRNLLVAGMVDGQATTHDPAVADSLGLAGAPIEGPTHISQFDPLAYALWGRRWFETGCISIHFQTMVFEGEQVTASISTGAAAVVSGRARIDAVKADGTPVLTGTVSIDPTAETELDRRLAVAQTTDPGELFIMDQLSIGMRSGEPVPTSIDMDSPNGDLYQFSLREKLATSTETSPWFADADNPWGRAILPLEAVALLAQKVPPTFPVRRPTMGLFIDMQVRLIDGPLFVDDTYLVTQEVVGLAQTRRTESHWYVARLSSVVSSQPVADVLMHIGAFKESYPGYPRT